MAKRSGPLDRAWDAALLVLGIALALWFTVQLLTDIWGWLLLLAVVAFALWVAVQLARRRRDRW